MKKSIVYLGVALIALSNVSFASNENPTSKKEMTALYEATTPLCVAISKGEVDFVKKLIEYGASINETSNGMTPLMVAARFNNVEILKLLVGKGADKSLKDDKGFTALKYAELSNAKEAAAFLKQ